MENSITPNDEPGLTQPKRQSKGAANRLSLITNSIRKSFRKSIGLTNPSTRDNKEQSGSSPDRRNSLQENQTDINQGRGELLGNDIDAFVNNIPKLSEIQTQEKENFDYAGGSAYVNHSNDIQDFLNETILKEKNVE